MPINNHTHTYVVVKRQPYACPAILSVTALTPCELAFSSDRPEVGRTPFFLQVFGGDHMQNKDF